MSVISTHINAISDVVGKVISATESAMIRQQHKHQNPNPNSIHDNDNDRYNNNNPNNNPNNNTITLRDRAGPIIRILADCRDSLAEVGEEGSRAMSASEMREVTGKLPPIAFRIARETKELVQRLDQMEMMGVGMREGGGGGGGGHGGNGRSVGGSDPVPGPVGRVGVVEDHDDDDDFR